MKKIPLIFFIFLSINCVAQLSKTHYIPPLTGSNSVIAQEHYFYISTPSISPVKVNINAIGVGTTQILVSQSSPFIVEIGNNPNSQLIVSPALLNTKLSDKGYIIESESLIYVSVRVLAGSYNQAGSLVSKGLAALGKQFRVGGFTNTATTNSSPSRYTFLSILATENNTKVEFINIKSGVTFVNNGSIINNSNITLDRGQSYLLAVEDNSVVNKDGLIGALVKSDKPIAFNCGSFGGTNGENNGNLDLGFDQIVPIENIKNPISNESEYIFVKGGNINIIERPLIIAHENNTEVFINGNSTPDRVLNIGDYYAIDGSMYSTNRNLYVKTSKPTFAYQSIGGTNQANQQLFFVPPLNCSTPKTVNNIPFIEKIGSRNFITNSGLNIVTGLNANLQLSINGVIYPITSLPLGIIASTANSVTGNINFETYTITGLTGNIGVFSNKQVYVSFFGTNGAATYGGYYSGFDIKPELSIDNTTSISGNCIPNVVLKTEPDSDYTYQWLNNGIEINGETGNTFTPSSPGYYQVKRTIPSCNTSNFSDKIPVSNCPTDDDTDSVPDDIDLDFDNDGITNCVESYGNSVVDLTATKINKNTYSNNFSKVITTSPINSTAVSVPLIEKNNGDFISEIPVGKGNSLEYKINFTNPISLALEYIVTGNSTDLINSEGEFIVKSDSNKTVTVLNPNNQLLIDTNYDGIYESNVTQHSSFEIRFRLNSTTPLAAGTGKFSFQSHLTNSITFIHKNLSEITSNKATFTIKAKCIPRDSDSDSTPDYLDLDSDNDGILDIIESQANTLVGTSVIDADKDGIYDVFGTGTIPQDSDQDSIPDYLDLDSDNDGIKDELETDQDQDNDGIRNYRDLDRENDGCNDVIEAGFPDGDLDGEFGVNPVSVNEKGLVSNAPYSNPNTDYSIAAPIIIDNLASVTQVCDKQNKIIVVNGNSGISYQWQKSIDEINWFDISDNATYSGSNTNSLKISDVNPTMSGEFYRVKMSKSGNSCGRISNTTKLLINPLPTVNSNIDLVQCIENTNMLFSTFNLTEKNNFISTNYNFENFTYYTTALGAELNNQSEFISNPISYFSDSKTIGVRIENSNGCVNFSTLNLILSSTKIPNSFEKEFEVCDDGINDNDGIASFNFKSIEDEIKQFLIPPYTNYDIKYYENEENALAEKYEIENISNYQNQNSPNIKFIWVRVDNKIDNSCYALGRHIKLIVNPKPNIDTNKEGKDDQLVCLNLPNLLVELNAGLQNETSITSFNYNWTKDGNEIANATNSVLNVNQEGIYSVQVSTPKGCFRNRIIKVTSSDIAKIENIDIVDLSVNNTVTITTSGKGNYEFSIDLPIGPFQESNFFDNVASGIRDVYVIDTKGCGTVKKTIAVVGVPKFFTPNQDGFNDFWNIKGIDATFNSKSIIYIFDRYGKLLKQMLPSSLGWDGTLNGAPLPSDDYWFTLQLEDGREAKGHFSLKR